jgi:hypothetical protein
MSSSQTTKMITRAFQIPAGAADVMLSRIAFGAAGTIADLRRRMATALVVHITMRRQQQLSGESG